MSVVSTMLLALAMSTDAFAAALGKGAALRKPQFREALRTGVIFGAIEAITPVVGWAIGIAATKYVVAWDRWIAFTLLGVLGVRMIYEGLHEPEPVESRPRSHPFWVLSATGFGTSIDAMAVGLGLAFLNVNILAIAAAIGVATLRMAPEEVSVRTMAASVGQQNRSVAKRWLRSAPAQGGIAQSS